MSLLQDLTRTRQCYHLESRRAQRILLRLRRGATPATRRLLLALEDEQDGCAERSSNDSYQAGLRDGIELMATLFGESQNQ